MCQVEDETRIPVKASEPNHTGHKGINTMPLCAGKTLPLLNEYTGLPLFKAHQQRTICLLGTILKLDAMIISHVKDRRMVAQNKKQRPGKEFLS